MHSLKLEQPIDTKAQVLSTVEAMTTAFNSGDIEGIMRTYEPAAVVLGMPGEPVQGDALLRAMFTRFISARAQFTFEGHDVVVAGDLAVHLTPWKMAGLGPGGSPISGSGLSVAVLRRQADGRWLMVIDNPFGDTLLQRAAERDEGTSLR